MVRDPDTSGTGRATIIAIVFVTVLMLLAATMFYFQSIASQTAEDWVLHTYKVTGHVQLLFNRLKDVDLGQRGFIISGDEQYLLPYYDAMQDSFGDDAKSDQLEQHHSISEELKILRNLFADNHVQQSNLDELDSDIQELEGYWRANIRAHKEKSGQAALQENFVQEDVVMGRIRSLSGIIMAVENHLLADRNDADRRTTVQINHFTYACITIFYVTVVASIWFYQGRRRVATITQQKLIEKLAASNTELERFAYVASHDMQEPLRMITSFGKLIAEEYDQVLDEQGKEYLDLVTQSSIRMQNMIEDLLNYARIGSEATRPVVIDSNEELEHVLENLSASIQERAATVTHDVLPSVKGNPVQFMRLLQNLIGNGLKYQQKDAKPHVHVGIEDQGDFWRFAVIDNGIGIAPEYAAQVFEPFKRLHVWEDYKGTGIGLAVCKKIVENHGGTIWVTSEVGKGSVFYFTLPKIKQEEI